MNRGTVSACLAYSMWGLLPLYWKHLTPVSASEILAHRAVWSLLVTALFLVFSGQAGVLRRPPALSVLRVYLASGLMIGLNWLLYIWSVTHGHVLEASLGYFLNPLVSVLCGRLLFGEELGPPQRAAVLLAALGVIYLMVRARASTLWISFALAITFCFYGILRKQAPLSSLQGMYLETLLMLPLALSYLLWLEHCGSLAFGHADRDTNLLLLGSGVVTLLPLLCFSDAAQRLPLSSLGMFQYISPSLQFGLAIGLYHEPFSARQCVGYLFIWAGLAVYVTSLRARTSSAGLRELTPAPAESAG